MRTPPLRVLLASLLTTTASTALADPPCAGYPLGLTSSFITAGNPAPGQVQHPADAWTFRHTNENIGPLMTGGIGGASPRGVWLTEGQPYQVPILGAVYSPDPLVNQNTGGFRRPPSFTGLLAHPGYPGLPLFLTWTVQSPMSLSNIEGNVEVLSPNGPSDGVTVTVFMHVNDGFFSIIGPIDVFPTASGNTPLTWLPIIPQPVNAGDRIVVKVECRAQPSEDWCNIDLRLNVLGPPQILRQPVAVNQCNAREAQFSIILNQQLPLTTYQWRRNGVPLNDGPAADGTIIAGAHEATLRLSNLGVNYDADFDCLFDTYCGGFTSAPARLTVRPCPCNLADVTQLGGNGPPDGYLTVDDIIAYLNAFFASNLAVADVAALGGSPGADGQLTADDVIVFLGAFFDGCSG